MKIPAIKAKTTKMPELLAPVGSIEHLKIAILSGASSVYLATNKFSARKYAENLSLKEIKEAVKFAHLYNVKVYAAVNILIKEEELLEVAEYLMNLYKIGVDAVLVQDVGLIKLIRDIVPKLAVHGSTQMNIQNKEGLKWGKTQGIKRFVLPRELSLNELDEMTRFAHKEGLEVEIFVHGALCYSYSGRCLFSSFKGGRSGNRGTCAQPCRQKYQIAIEEDQIAENKKNNSSNTAKKHDRIAKKELRSLSEKEKYYLSTKDISLYEELETLEKTGVDCLKIEGRMRSKEYVAIVVNSYRKALNNLKYKIRRNKENNLRKKQFKSKSSRLGRKKNNKLNEIDEKDQIAVENLKLVFNREFTKGHLFNQTGKITNIENPGYHGLYIGKVESYSKKTNEIAILMDPNLKTIPEKGDGLEIKINRNFKNKSGKSKDKNENSYLNKNDGNSSDSYGLELSKEPVLKEKNDSRFLIIKKVRENKNINVSIDKGSKVYLNKKKAILDFSKSLNHDNSKQIIRKSVVFLYFSIDSSNLPTLKGKVILANGKKISLKKKGKVPWEIAKNKPISKKQLQKQLSKIENDPFYIEKISFSYDENLFTPLSQINVLRREFFKDLKKLILDSYLPNEEELKVAKNKLKRYTMHYTEKVHGNKPQHTTNGTGELHENKPQHTANDTEKIHENKSQNSSLSIYLNDLELLKVLNRHEAIYKRVYLEIPLKTDIFDLNNDKKKNKGVDISYLVSFIKEAIAISNNQKYELIWKWSDIAHQETVKDFIKALAILNKLKIKINIMTSLLGIADYLKENYGTKVYGSHHLNIYNHESVLNLNNYDLLTVSPELSKNDMNSLIKGYFSVKSRCESKNSVYGSITAENIPEIEIMVHGNIELMTSKNQLISKKMEKSIKKVIESGKHDLNRANDKNNESNKKINVVLKDSKNNVYPIKKNIDGSETILNSKDLCLLDDIQDLKAIGLENFAVDGRWKSKDEIINIGEDYKKAIER